MPVTPSHESAWSLRGTVAELISGALRARVDASRPDLGAEQVQWRSTTLAGLLLAVGGDTEATEQVPRWPLPLADVYTRGDDLIASYSPRDDWPFSPQIYWRAASVNSHETLDSLSLLVSVQTHLLDTRPCIRVGSRIEAAEVMIAHVDDRAIRTEELGRADYTFLPAARASTLIVRPAAADYSYVEIMPASDFREATVRWTANGICETCWRLFADFLEKGVIWRARLHSLFISRANDVEVATRVCRALDERPLPLTV